MSLEHLHTAILVLKQDFTDHGIRPTLTDEPFADLLVVILSYQLATDADSLDEEEEDQ